VTGLTSTGNTGYMKRWLLVRKTEDARSSHGQHCQAIALQKSEIINVIRKKSYCKRVMHSKGKSSIQWDNL